MNSNYLKSSIFLLFTVVFNYRCTPTLKVLELTDSLEVNAKLLYEEDFDDNLDAWQV